MEDEITIYFYSSINKNDQLPLISTALNMHCLTKFVFLIYFLGLSNFASAQLSKAKIAEFLTNDSIRAWQFKEIRQSLGSSNCKGDGLTLIFNKNFQVTLRRCEKGKIIITKTTWAITVLNEEIREFAIKFNDSLKISDDYWLMNARIDLPYPGLKKRNKQLILRHIDTPVSQRRVREIITFLSLY